MEKMILTFHTLEHTKEINKMYDHMNRLVSSWLLVEFTFSFFFITCKDHHYSSYFVFAFFFPTSENAVRLFPNDHWDLFPLSWHLLHAVCLQATGTIRKCNGP